MFQSLVYPMFAMVLLTFIVAMLMVRIRVGAVKSGQVDFRYFKTYRGDAPPKVEQAGRHFTNIFELPVLFYVACLTAMSVHIDGQLLIALAWSFVVLRVVHAFIHMGSNSIRPRMAIYVLEWVVVLAMWIMMIIGLGAR